MAAQAPLARVTEAGIQDTDQREAGIMTGVRGGDSIRGTGETEAGNSSQEGIEVSGGTTGIDIHPLVHEEPGVGTGRSGMMTTQAMATAGVVMAEEKDISESEQFLYNRTRLVNYYYEYMYHLYQDTWCKWQFMMENMGLKYLLSSCILKQSLTKFSKTSILVSDQILYLDTHIRAFHYLNENA